MTRLLASLLFLLPFATSAPAADDSRSKAVPIGSIIDDRVMSDDERDIGELEDVLLTSEGELREYLIDFDEPNDNYNRGATTFRDDVSNYQERPLYEGESVEGELQFDFVAAPPDRVDLARAAEDVIIVNLGPEGFSALPPRDERRFAQREFVRGSEVIGMEVAVGEQDSFGTVEDILLAPDAREIAAYVVDSWDGLDKRRIAVPAKAVTLVRADRDNAIREEFGVTGVRIEMSLQEIDALPEIDLDDYDNGLL